LKSLLFELDDNLDSLKRLLLELVEVLGSLRSLLDVEIRREGMTEGPKEGLVGLGSGRAYGLQVS
jgi:hypothetical protein